MMALYDRSSSQEIYQVKLSTSKLFAEYDGKSFVEAAYGALGKEVCLLGVRAHSEGPIHLNPGKVHTMVRHAMRIHMLTHSSIDTQSARR